MLWGGGAHVTSTEQVLEQSLRGGVSLEEDSQWEMTDRWVQWVSTCSPKPPENNPGGAGNARRGGGFWFGSLAAPKPVLSPV